MQTTPFTPPLSYNYLCGSTLLATYLPVYCYLYTIQIILIPLIIYLLASYMPYKQLPKWIRLRFSGIIWPSDWSPNEEIIHQNNSLIEFQDISSVKSILARDAFVSKFAEDILNLITFGLCCPLLGLAITLLILMNLFILRCLIGRFLLIKQNITPSPDTLRYSTSSHPGSTSSNIAYHMLHKNLHDLGTSYYNLLWIVLWSSCFFVSFLCWDIAGDTAGALESIWLPILAVSFVLSLQIFERFTSNETLIQNEVDSPVENGINLAPIRSSQCPSNISDQIDISQDLKNF